MTCAYLSAEHGCGAAVAAVASCSSRAEYQGPAAVAGRLQTVVVVAAAASVVVATITAAAVVVPVHVPLVLFVF